MKRFLIVICLGMLGITACTNGGDGTTVVVEDGGAKTTTPKPDAKTPTAGTVGTNVQACLELAQWAIDFGLLSAKLVGASQADIDAVKRHIAVIEAEVPAELAKDWAIVSSAFKTFVDAVEANGITSPQAAAAAQKLQSPEVTAAEAAIERWVDQYCDNP